MFNKTIFFLVFTLVFFSCSNNNKNKEEEKDNVKPNIILILADDLGYGDLSCYGQENFTTPNIDKLAKEGIRFTQHYAGSTVCSPSRNSLMTGFHMGHATIHGNGSNPDGEGDMPIPAKKTTFVKYLQKSGYKTGIFGKWGLGDCDSEGSPLKHGFDEFFGYTNQILAHNSFPEYLLQNCEKVYLKNEVKYLDKKSWHKGLGSISTKKVEFSNDLIFDKALKFIEKNKSGPFFLYFPTTIPHMNDEAQTGEHFEIENSDEFADKNWSEDEKHYALLVKRLDSYIGILEKKIEQLGLAKNTLIIFTSDNGAVQGIEHLSSNGDLRGYKRDLYEGGIRVPFIAKWPDKIQANTVSDHISALWDYFPTLLDIAQIKADSVTDGISFLPVLLNRGKQKEHKYLYWEFHWWKPSRQAIRLEKWKGVRNTPDSKTELYDLSSDISESHDVAGEHPEIIKEIEDLFVKARTDDERWKLKK